MPATTAQQDYFTFLEEYTQFLERMTEDESEKLAALSSRDLPRIEQSITVSQANAKRLENYELKRVEIQDKAGYGGCTFAQLLERTDPFEQDWLRQVFDRFERSVSEIRFRNDKSMAVARDNMLAINPDAVLPGPGTKPGAKAQNPYAKIREEAGDSTGMLETKV